MLGDAADLVKIVGWAKKFWRKEEAEEEDDDSEEERGRAFTWSADTRRAVAEVVLDLASVFENVEKQVRKHYYLAGAKKAKSVRFGVDTVLGIGD